MQILEHGDKAPIITCSCGCKFLFEVGDIKTEITTSGEEEETRRYVVCPECGEETDLTEE